MTRIKLYKIIGLIVITTAAIFLALMLMPPSFDIGDATILLRPRSEARLLLEKLGLPDNTTQVSSITVYGPDGPMPEIATRSFIVNSSNYAALQEFYRERCKAIAFSEPDKDLLRLEPATLCSGREPSGMVNVLLFPDCTDLSCSVNIEVRILVM